MGAVGASGATASNGVAEDTLAAERAAPGVEGIVKGEDGLQQFLVIGDVRAKTERDRQAPRRLCRSFERVGVGCTHDFRQAHKSGVLEAVFLEVCIETAQGNRVGELNPGHIEGNSAFAFRDRQHLCGRHIMNLGVPVDEATDEPRAGESIDLGALTGDPLHGGTPVMTASVVNVITIR
jgi:hypothetical protein